MGDGEENDPYFANMSEITETKRKTNRNFWNTSFY